MPLFNTAPTTIINVSGGSSSSSTKYAAPVAQAVSLASFVADVSVGFTTYYFNAATIASWLPQLITDFNAAGFKRLRFQLPWPFIEQVQGVYTWTTLDDAVSKLNTAGIKITYSIQGSPIWWPTQGGYSYPPQSGYGSAAFPDPVAMTTFAIAVATRYNGSNGHGTIDKFDFNEDFDSYGSGGDTNVFLNRHPQFWRNVALKAAPAIRAANPSAKISTCAIWWNELHHISTFLQDAYDYGYAGMFDEFNIHWYPYESGSNANQIDAANWCYTGITNYQAFQVVTPNFHQALNAMLQVMTSNNDLKPIRVTEYGYLINANGHNSDNLNNDIITEPIRWRNFWYINECMRRQGCCNGGDIWTYDGGGLDGTGTSAIDGDSLVQYSGGWVYGATWQGMKAYVARWPTFAANFGYLNTILAADNFIVMSSSLSPHAANYRNASTTQLGSSSAGTALSSDQQAYAVKYGSGVWSLNSSSIAGLASSGSANDIQQLGTGTYQNVEVTFGAILNNASDAVGPTVCYASGACYWFRLTNGTISICKMSGGAVSSVLASASLTTTLGQEYKIRGVVNAGVLKVVTWQDLTTEPSSWSATYTDGSALSAGGFGICAKSTAGTGAQFTSLLVSTSDATLYSGTIS